MIDNLTDQSFADALVKAGGKLVLVDVWADWCGPCKILAPTLEMVAEDFANSVLFYKLDADSNKEIPTKYNVRGLPTLMLFKDGDCVAEFDHELQRAKGLLLVDFWAEWCGPCRMIGPILDELAEEMSDSVVFCKMNVDNNKATPAKYEVRGIPAIMLFKNSELVATKVGAMSKSQLVSFIQEHV